ncbi:MAG: KH domain-containing protein [Thermoplasmata archaeon]
MSLFYVRIPLERVGALIGEEGRQKKEIEKKYGVKIFVDSETGETTIDATGVNDPLLSLKLRDYVVAVGRGFSPERAKKILEEDTYFECIDIKEYTGKSKEALVRVRARLIGKNGKTRRIIEELTGTEVSIYGHTVSIIGQYENFRIAKEAIEMLLRGSEHSTVYRFLERKREELRIYEMGFTP